MKRRFRIAVLYIFLFAAAVALAAKKIPFGKIVTQQTAEVPAEAIARSVYILSDTDWTTFRVPAATSRLTILSRVHFRFGMDLLNKFFPYSMSYRLERLNGALVSEGTFDQRTDFLPMVDEIGRRTPAAFFSGEDTTISSSKASILEISPGEILVLRVRLKSCAPSISEISMRVFQTREMDQKRPAHLWNRLSSSSRERIGERRVHNLANIRPGEQLSILRNRPVPLGASGIGGKDFEQATLYIRKDLIPELRKIIEPLGVGEIRCNSTRRAMIGIPRPGGKIRLNVRSENSATGNELIIRYFGETIREREVFRKELKSNVTEFFHTFKPGLLEIESPIGVTIRPWLQIENAPEKELQLDPSKIRAWRVETGHSVTFTRENRTGAGFLKVSARPLGDKPATIHYSKMDGAGQVLSIGSRTIEAISSVYDFELTAKDELPVNDPQHMVLRLSSEVASVKFKSDERCMINGYSRPSGLVHQTRVPADYDRALPDPDRLPVWFWVRPEGADTLIKSHRSHLLQIQVRPPVDDEHILAGRYQWQDFQPVNGVGQYLFREVEEEASFQNEALPSLFAPLSIGHDAPFYPETLPGLQRPTRRLAFVRSDSTPQDISLYIDGRPLFNRRLVTACGEIALPPLPDLFSTARVEYSGSDLQCFLNYVKPDTATRLKRRGQRVASGRTFEYHCEKVTPDEELLTGMLFAVEGSVEDSEISVSIEPVGEAAFLEESDSFTIRERSWSISPNQESKTPVLGGGVPTVDGGRRFFIPLGRDMTPGFYRVIFSCGSGPGGFLTLSKVLGGDYNKARFFRDISR